MKTDFHIYVSYVSMPSEQLFVIGFSGT